MFVSTRRQIAFPITRLVSHIRTPLYRNGYALILSSTVTSALGVVYWILAAHTYSASVVGLNSAAISAMMFLAGVAQLNLMSALVRFIPAAGRTTWRLVVSAYLITVILALLVSFIFIQGLDIWAPRIDFLRTTPYFSPWFIVATMSWCLFVLQDSVLTGLGQAVWVPLENTVFATAKIILLIILVQLFPQYGVFASWTFAVLVALFPTNVLIFWRLIPRHAQTTGEQIAPEQIARYVAFDYFGSLFWLVSTALLPVIVTQLVGATANAYFYLSWTIAYSLYLVSPNMGSSLIVEAATDQTKLGIYSYRVFVNTARLLIPTVALMILGAPYILRIFGSDYALEGTTLLRLLLLSAIPNIVNALYISIARVQRRLWALVTVLAILCTLVLALSYILLRLYGIIGVGLAWLISQTLVAVVLWLFQLQPLWFSGWGGLNRTVSRRLLCLAFNIAVKLRLLAIRRWWCEYRHSRGPLAEEIRLLPLILKSIPPQPDMSGATLWRVQRVIPTVTDMRVIIIGPPKQSATAVIKLPQTQAAVTSLRQQSAILTMLRADPRLREWSVLLPVLWAKGDLAGQYYAVEQMLPGLDARRVLSNPATCRQIQMAAASAIGELHRRTAASVAIDAGLLARWIDEPLALIREVSAAFSPAAGHDVAIKRLTEELYNALTGRMLALSWVHGDFVPGNILVTPDGSRLVGIVDWELARPNDLPLLDLLQLFLSTRVLTQRREVGDVIVALLNGAAWLPHEQALLNSARAALPGDEVDLRAMLLLCWLRHIAANLTKSTRYAGNWLWVTKNIETVLQEMHRWNGH